MEITILGVIQTGNITVVSVRFRSRYGIGQAKWHGETPQIGMRYHVELEIRDQLIGGKNITKADMSTELVDTQNGTFYLQGVLDSIGLDDYCLIRLGDSFVTCLAKNLSIAPGNYVRIEAYDVTLFDMNM